VSRSYRVVILIAPLITLAPMSAQAQSSVAVSPFVSLVPSSSASPLAGLALTFGGTTGLALRGSADMSIANPNKLDSSAAGSRYRPWGADADAMLFLGGLGGGATVFSRALAPYVFSGIFLTSGDSAGRSVPRNGWSYGAGATIPLGLDADIFGEARWRMPEYVLPTSRDAPSSKSEFRFGLSFHVGGGGSREAPAPRRRGRGGRYESDYEDVAVAPAPAPATATATAVNVNMPAVVLTPSSRSGVRHGGVRQSSVMSDIRVVTPERNDGVRYRRRSLPAQATVQAAASRTSQSVRATVKSSVKSSASKTKGRAGATKVTARRRAMAARGSGSD
jgi:hypothetical protein